MLKVAIIGCGLIATKKHIPTFYNLRNKTTIVALCDSNENLVRTVAREFNILHTYEDSSEMLLKETPEVVVLCTPPRTHAKLAIEAMKKGSHVLIEKPMALNVSDCEAIIEASKRHKRKVCTIHNQIFNPAFMKARKLVLKGEIGNFLGMRIFLSTPTAYMTSQKGHWVHRLPGGVLGETGPHAVYLTLAFLKNVREVEISTKKHLPEFPWSDAEDYRIEVIADNGISSIALAYGSNQWASNIDIHGTTGILHVDLETRTVVKYNRPKLEIVSVSLSQLNIMSQMFKNFISNGSNYLFSNRLDGHSVCIFKFIDSILNDNASPVTCQEAKDAVHILETIVGKLKEKDAYTSPTH